MTASRTPPSSARRASRARRDAMVRRRADGTGHPDALAGGSARARAAAGRPPAQALAEFRRLARVLEALPESPAILEVRARVLLGLAAAGSRCRAASTRRSSCSTRPADSPPTRGADHLTAPDRGPARAAAAARGRLPGGRCAVLDAAGRARGRGAVRPDGPPAQPRLAPPRPRCAVRRAAPTSSVQRAWPTETGAPAWKARNTTSATRSSSPAGLPRASRDRAGRGAQPRRAPPFGMLDRARVLREAGLVDEAETQPRTSRAKFAEARARGRTSRRPSWPGPSARSSTGHRDQALGLARTAPTALRAAAQPPLAATGRAAGAECSRRSGRVSGAARRAAADRVTARGATWPLGAGRAPVRSGARGPSDLAREASLRRQARLEAAGPDPDSPGRQDAAGRSVGRPPGDAAAHPRGAGTGGLAPRGEHPPRAREIRRRAWPSSARTSTPSARSTCAPRAPCTARRWRGSGLELALPPRVAGRRARLGRAGPRDLDPAASGAAARATRRARSCSPSCAGSRRRSRGARGRPGGRGAGVRLRRRGRAPAEGDPGPRVGARGRGRASPTRHRAPRPAAAGRGRAAGGLRHLRPRPGRWVAVVADGRRTRLRDLAGIPRGRGRWSRGCGPTSTRWRCRPCPTPLRAAVRRSLDLGLAGSTRPAGRRSGSAAGAPGALLQRRPVFLPWGLLPSRAGTPTSVTPSAAAWLRARASPPPPRPLVVAVAGPDLRLADAEAAAVAGLWPGARAARR